MLAKSAKIRRYRQKIEQFRQNRIFDSGLKKTYAEFNGDGVRLNDVQILKKAKDFGVIFGASGNDITEKQNG